MIILSIDNSFLPKQSIGWIITFKRSKKTFSLYGGIEKRGDCLHLEVYNAIFLFAKNVKIRKNIPRIFFALKNAVLPRLYLR